MNKIYKVIWNEALNAYVVVSEIAKNHGSKSCSTKKLLAMLIAIGVMTCASFDVLAAEPVAEKTAAQQYVALKAADFPANGPSRGNRNTWGGLGSYGKAEAEWNYQSSGSKDIGDYTYTYDRTNKYWVRDGYVLIVDENGGKYTPFSADKIHVDVAYTGTGVPEGILQSVTSTASANGTVTNMGESLNKVTAGSFAGVSHSGGTKVAGSWRYIIHDPSWEGFVDAENYKDGYVDLKDNKMPKGFITADSQKGLVWDNNKAAYIYKGKAVDYSNVYVIDGHIGVFTDKSGDEVYTGTVYGKNNEILMTVKDKDNKFYSYWAAEVTDPSATMATYRVEEYNKNLAKLVENDDALYRNDIKEVTLTKDTNSATIGLMRNGDKAVDGAITVTSGGGTGGSDAGNDTFVKISNGKTEQTFATGSKVEAIGSKDATTGIKINGENYTIKSGSVVSVAQNAAKKTTTLTVDGKATTITDTDTKYTEGKGIAIDENNGNAISVKLKEDENNLEVTEAGLALKKDLTVDSVKAGKFYMSNAGIGYGDKVYITSSGLNANSQKITGVAEGTISKDSTDAVNGSQLKQTNENVAALDKRVTQNEADIAQNKTDIKNLDTRVTNVEELAKKHTTVTAGDNIAVTESPNKDDGKEYKVALDKNINLDSVTTGQTVMNNDGLKVGKDVSVTATAVTAGKTSISDEGVKVGNKTYISDKGLNANDQKVTNVAVGELSATSKDAVNGSQLYETNQAIANNATNISSLSHSISNLDNRVNKVGAGAAALAALHPLDFDPDAKWDFAAGYGNYRGANAAAVGAYYRPNEDTMFSVGGTFGNGENMVNAGVSFKLGSGSSHVSTSRVAMAKEIKELRGELEAMKSAMLDANAGKKIDTSKLQLFPDVPQNHWAYEYVAQLAGNGMIEGYPDGNFAGDRPMTRYEFAAILYRAMTKGAVLSDKILSEFSHELEYFTVDTIAKDKAGNPTIQRVRTVKENKNK